MKIRLLISLCSLLLLLVMACEKDEPLNLEDLEWLEEKINELQQSSISQYFYIQEARYKNKRVFVMGNCCPFCNTITPVYSEEGELLGYIGDTIIANELSDVKLFWEPDDAACQH